LPELKNHAMNTDKSIEFYKKLKSQLSETSSWPSEYLYKFIVKTDQEKIKEIEHIFDNTGAVIETNVSKKGKYTSVSVNVVMKDPDAVILKYKEVAKQVKGVISL
jgi:putative lipoic acid-binding regulatory protein